MAEDQAISQWYNSLYSRTVDLVGDYAGEEMFVIEGDSLLLQSFSDPKLDFSSGFQLLHAVYIVEKYLRNLHQRKCQFHVIFFDEHASVSIPKHAPSSVHYKYRIAREILIQHLTQNLPASAPEVQVHQFPSIQSAGFEDYLDSTGAYFIMCHDGAGTTSKQEKLILRSMILWFTIQGYNVALINGIEFRDTKVLVMVAEGSAKEASSLEKFVSAQKTEGAQTPKPIAPNAEDTVKKALSQALRTIKKESGPVSQRRLLTLATLSTLIDESSTQLDTGLVSAVILHLAALESLQVSDRRIDEHDATPDKTSEAFAEQFGSWISTILSSNSWKEISNETDCDLADFFDGRVFNYMVKLFKANTQRPAVGPALEKAYQHLASILKDAFETESKPIDGAQTNGSASKMTKSSQPTPSSILPFHNTVFDAHLAPVGIVTKQARATQPPDTTNRIFTELTHWGNSKRPVENKVVTPQDERLKKRALRRDQIFQAEIRDYAASLTNATGGILQPETIIAKSISKQDKKASGASTPAQAPTAKESAPKDKSKGKPGSKNAAKVGRGAVKDSVAEFQQQKLQKERAIHFSAWKVKLAEFEKDTNPINRYIRLNQYLTTLVGDKRRTLDPSIKTYQLTCLLTAYAKLTEETRRIPIAALAWYTIRQISLLKQGVTEDAVIFVNRTVDALGLPMIQLEKQSEGTSSVPLYQTTNIGPNLKVSIDPKTFQLLHAGPFLDRDMGSSSDNRVQDFRPDRWQRDVLDAIDAKSSLLVVAPTSAGKTFISFYAMKQVLEEDDDGILVYVAPTKALVNQIAAEVHARFTKSAYKFGGRSVWGIHTRDVRINNPTGCQVLVTVPHILQIMLMAPSNANSWSRRVKRIIFDEVHCIGQAEDGIVWEQLLLMAPCPIIALSATVGNPKEFHDWLDSTQRANGRKVALIQHRHRYSDLRKYIYKPPKTFTFQGLPLPERSGARFSPLGLDDAQGLAYMHPVSSVINRSRGIPDDLSLEARDCLLLWKAMAKYATTQHPLDPNLDPDKCLPKVVRKIDIFTWEEELKNVLKTWIDDRSSPFDRVIRELDASVEAKSRPDSQTSKPITDEVEPTTIDNPDDILATTLPLICTLRDNDALPALFFNYDRTNCENIAQNVLEQLVKAETDWKENSADWKTKLVNFEKWKKTKGKASSTQKAPKMRSQEGQLSKAELDRESAETDKSPFEKFDPDAKQDGFHLAEVKNVDPEDLVIYRKQLEYREVPGWLIDALERGVGVHHAGMNRKYRQICEILFRKKYLQVVIATGTLALGINMPCKTVVFSGDSIFLTALNFRQAAGRAGRRGYDLLGNVVFQGLPYSKVCRLLSSRLPDLHGHFPITTTMVLRLFNLLHESKDAKFAIDTINSILSQPRIYLGGNEAQHTVLHHLRFSVEYLRRNYLLNESGQGTNFSGAVAHLYFTENSSFAFHALLKGGYFHSLCRNFNSNRKEVLLELMLVMSHLFGRRNLRESTLDQLLESNKTNSASVVLLPPLPEKAMYVLKEHDQQTLDVYKSYIKTYVSQHLQKDVDNSLPLTNKKCGGKESASILGRASAEPVYTGSPFVALSGFTDSDVKNIPDLCSTVRNGVFLEQAVIPYVDTGSAPLNAYLYDFYKHGSVVDLARANDIRKGDVWFVLKDFSLILATIVTSFKNFLKLSPASDLDMLDVIDAGDVHEEALDDKELNLDGGIGAIPTEQFKTNNPILAKKEEFAALAKPRKVKTKAKVADSWDDDASEEEESSEDEEEDETDDDDTEDERDDRDFLNGGVGLKNLLAAFAALQTEFDVKFREMWA